MDLKSRSRMPLKSPSKSRLKFATPIKILVIEPRAEYYRTVWGAIAVGLSHILLGATVMASIMYSLHAKDTHAALCTLGFHFFTAEAILGLTYLCGWSTPMHLKHRLGAHIILQTCAIMCVTVGSALVLVSKGVSLSAHGITGMVATVLAIVGAIFGVIAYRRRRGCFRVIHVSIGIPAFLISSICLCFGLATVVFRTWAGLVATGLLMGFIIFYTVCIITSSFIKCMITV